MCFFYKDSARLLQGIFFFEKKKVQEKVKSLELTNFRRHHIILLSEIKEVVAQWLERRPVTSKVAGSSPVNLVFMLSTVSRCKYVYIYSCFRCFTERSLLTDFFILLTSYL